MGWKRPRTIMHAHSLRKQAAELEDGGHKEEIRLPRCGEEYQENFVKLLEFAPSSEHLSS
jgi:hypothetical protein